jgi:alpha-tubulin suppressor-like RCC1 family protein
MRKNYKKIVLLTSLTQLINVNILQAQSIACGGWHSLAICSDSTVKGFGENASSQLGDLGTTDKSTPVTAVGLSGIIAVSAGGDQLEAHSMALKSNGAVYAWGSNIYGELGNGNTTNNGTPTQVLLLSSGVKAISCGGWHSVALKNDGTVWTWGWNTDGQLGDGTFVDKTVPVQVSGLSGIIKIASGTYHVLALKNDGTVWAWGDNVAGQVGDGTTADRNTPYQITGLTGIVKITTGRFFSMAIKNDGTVWTWGENLYGQLGNGSVVNSSVPVQVSGLTGITNAVAATGAFHCLAVKSDGTIWSWGRNTYGNLGDGTTTHQYLPVQVSGLTNAIGLAAGTNFSLFYKSDGTMYGCGRNLSGQLGDGTFTQRNTPYQSNVICPILQPLAVGINDYENISNGTAHVFPNPSSNGAFNLEIENSLLSNNSNAKVQVYDALGQLVLETVLNDNTLINLTEKADGLYYLKLNVGSKTYNQKLLKQ